MLPRIPQGSCAVVMATVIVSVGLALDGRMTLSRILLALGALVWAFLAAQLLVLALRDRERARAEARSPATLTSVAGTAVLGSRLTQLGWSAAAAVLLVLALILWLALLGPVLRGWRTPTVGRSFLIVVSTEALAALAAALARQEAAGWLLVGALALALLGLCSYLYVIVRFDVRQLLLGRGDQWVAGGALAISALAAGQITIAARDMHTLAGSAGVLEVVSVVLWGLSIAWLPILLASEALRPRAGYDVRRWSTVFPVGMYAACSFIAGAAARASALIDFGRIWVWVGLAAWAIVFAAMLRSGLGVGRGSTFVDE